MFGFTYGNVKYNPEYIKYNEIKTDSNEETKESLYVYVVGDSQYRKYIKSLGLNYEDIKNKGILDDYMRISTNTEGKRTTHKYMREEDYKVGDKLSGKLSNDLDYTFEIGYITDELPFGVDTDDKVLIVSDELFDKVVGTSSSMKIVYKSNDASKLQDDIDEYLKDEIYSLDNKEERVNMLTNLLILVGIFLYGFIIVVSLIGITNVFNTITTNMELRKPEFAMLKSIGMTSKEFKRMISLESLFMGFKSLFYGTIIGIILSYLIYRNFNSTYLYEVPYLSIIICIIAVFLLIFLIMRYSLNKINKQNIIETIRNENI